MCPLQCQGVSCRVRAGARNVEKAQKYLKIAISFGLIAPEAARRLSIVEVDLTDEETIAPAIGKAGKVGCVLWGNHCCCA